MKIRMKLGTLPVKTYEAKDYDSIDVGTKIEVLIQGKWKLIKVWQIYDDIPVLYFGEYL